MVKNYTKFFIGLSLMLTMNILSISNKTVQAEDRNQTYFIRSCSSKKPSKEKFYEQTVYVWKCNDGYIVQDKDTKQVSIISGAVWKEFESRGSFRKVGLPMGNQVVYKKNKKVSYQIFYRGDKKEKICILHNKEIRRTTFSKSVCNLF